MRNGIPEFMQTALSPAFGRAENRIGGETMKRCLSFLLLLFLFVFGAAAPDAGPGENAAHLYAGRPQLLPFEVKGEFVIRTRHGRILGSGAGAGQLTVQVPGAGERRSGRGGDRVGRPESRSCLSPSAASAGAAGPDGPCRAAPRCAFRGGGREGGGGASRIY